MDDEETIRLIAESDLTLAEFLLNHYKRDDFRGRLSREMLTYTNSPGLSELDSVVDGMPEAALWVIAAARMVTWHCGSNPSRAVRDVLLGISRRNPDFVPWLREESRSPDKYPRRLAGDALALLEAAPGWEKRLFEKP